MLVLILALFSVSSQHFLSFGEFLEGHEGANPPAILKFIVKTSSDKKLNGYLMFKKIEVGVQNGDTLLWDDDCNGCYKNIKDPKWLPNCAVKKCSKNDKFVWKNYELGINQANMIFFNDAANNVRGLLRTAVQGTFRMEANNGFIDVVRTA